MQEASKKEAQRIGYAMVGGLIIGLIIHSNGFSHYVDYIKLTHHVISINNNAIHV